MPRPPLHWKLPLLQLVFALLVLPTAVAAQGTGGNGSLTFPPPPQEPRGSFTEADLDGAWTGTAISDDVTENDPELTDLLFVVEDGSVTGIVSEFDNETETVTHLDITAGEFSITKYGAVSGSFEVDGVSESHSFSYFQMNESRDFIAGVLDDSNAVDEEVVLVALAKIDPDRDYTVTDLEGTWAAFVYSENIDQNDPSSGYAVFEIDAGGVVTDGFKDGPEGPEAWPSGLQFEIDEWGRISEISGQLGGEPVLQLAEGRHIAVGSIIGFFPGGEGDHRIVFLVKETSGVVASDLAGDWLVFGIEDDQQANNPATFHGGVRFDSAGSELEGGTIYSSDDTMEPDLIAPHVVDVQPDGEVTLEPNAIVAWGLDSYGQASNTPTGTGFKAIAAGSTSLALRDDGSIEAWGYDADGSVSNAPTETGFTAIAGGVGHNLALRGDGSIEAWGEDHYSQVSNTPTGTGFKAIAAADFYSFALREDGSIEAWGDDSLGQVSNTPTGTGFTAIAAGRFHNLALRDDGSIEAWGDNPFGQVSDTPTGTGFTAIAAGASNSLALRDDGSIEAWGDNPFGQVSDTPTGTGYTAIAAGQTHSLALRDDGSIEAWGDNHFSLVSNTPTGTEFKAIAAGNYHSLALREDDSPITFQFSPEAGVMIGTHQTEDDHAEIILAFVPEPGAALLGIAALAALGALPRRRRR
jgi:alpha-tubulin suppressor-like RCC1 family protein